jgi:hypothetical protein
VDLKRGGPRYHETQKACSSHTPSENRYTTIDQIVWKLHDEQLAAYIAYVLTVSKGEKREIRKLWLANCYLAHDSSGFPVQLPFSRLPHACHQSRHHVAARGRKQHCWKPRTQSE